MDLETIDPLYDGHIPWFNRLINPPVEMQCVTSVICICWTSYWTTTTTTTTTLTVSVMTETNEDFCFVSFPFLEPAGGHEFQHDSTSDVVDYLATTSSPTLEKIRLRSHLHTPYVLFFVPRVLRKPCRILTSMLKQVAQVIHKTILKSL